MGTNFKPLDLIISYSIIYFVEHIDIYLHTILANAKCSHLLNDDDDDASFFLNF